MSKPFHRLWLGDSTQLLQKVPDSTVDCVITDPPFGADNQSNQAVTEAGKRYARKIANDETPEQAIGIFKAVMSVLVPKVKHNADIHIFTNYLVLKEWLVMCDDFLGRHNFTRKAVAPWIKDGPGMGDTEFPFGMGMEFILMYRRGNIPKKIQRRNAALNFSQIRPDKLIHPHEKPLPLLETLLKASTDPGDFVV